MATDYIVPDSYATIALAIAAAEAVGPAGGIARVRIKANTYTEKNLTFTIDWTQTAWLSIESFSGAQDVIQDINGAAFGDRVYVGANHKYIKFQNLLLTAQGAGSSRSGFQNFSECYFKNVTTHYFTAAPYSGLVGRCTWEDCESDHNAGNGFGVISFGYHVFRRCKSHHNTLSGFDLGRYPNQVIACAAWRNTLNGFHVSYATAEHEEHIILNSVAFGNTVDGLRIDGLGQCARVVNCVFRSNGAYGIRLPAARGAVIFDPLPRCEANCYSNNTSGILYDGTNTVTTLAGMQTYTGQDALSTVAVPGFTNEVDGSEDFDLAVGSALINAGVGSGVALDWKGVAFPDPHHLAIGCAANRDVEIDLWPAAGKVASGAAFDQTAKAAGTRTDCPAAHALLGEKYGDPAAQITGELESVDPGVAFVIREADGGPASYKINSVVKVPAFDLAGAEIAYEAGRNEAIDPGKYLAPTPFRQFGVDDVGVYEPPDPQVPTVQPVLNSVVVAQATGLVTCAWSPGHAGAHVFLYRRRAGVEQKTLVGELTGAGPHDDLSALAHDTYYYSVSQELDDGGDPSGFPGRPDSAELALDWTGATPEYSPLEDLRQQLADSDAWRLWVGDGAGGPATRAAALARAVAVYYEPENVATELPYILLSESQPTEHEQVALGAWLPHGEVTLRFIAAPGAGLDEGAAVEAFRALVDGVLADLRALAGRDDHRDLSWMAYDDELRRTHPTERQAADVLTAQVVVEWGL